MKERTKGIIAGALAATVITGGAVYAKEAAETITAVYRNIKLVVDGVQIDPQDVNGNTVEPFIYNGTTYLPVRAVGKAFDKEVSWDGDSSTVYIGGEVDKPARALSLHNRSYLECSSTGEMSTYEKDGNTYISCDNKKNLVKDGAYWSRTFTIKYPLNSCAKTLSGEFYLKDDSTAEGVLRILDSNGREIYESPIVRSVTSNVPFEVNVEGEISVTFEFKLRETDSWTGAEMLIKNPTIVTTDY